MWVVFKKYFPIKDFNFSYLMRTYNHRLKTSKYKSSFNFPWIQNLHGTVNNKWLNVMCNGTYEMVEFSETVHDGQV